MENKPILIYRTTRNNQTVTLTNHAEYFSSVIIVETGEELIQQDLTDELKYTFPQKGEHPIAIQFKKGITDLSGCFWGCENLVSIPKGLFDTCTEVKKLEWCFAKTGIKEIPARLFKSCSKIEDLGRCFEECGKLKSIPEGLFDACTEVKNLSHCFAETDIKKLPEELFKYCSKIENLESCFWGCENLVSIPDGLLDACTEIKDLDRCFCRTGIKEIPKGLFKCCTKIENLNYCFEECRKLEHIPDGLLDKCKEVKGLSNCFSKTDIKEIPEGFFRFCNKVEDLHSCFRGCKKLEGIPKGLLNECKEVKDLSACFAETDIKEIPEGLFRFCNKVENLYGCFLRCKKLKGIPKGLLNECKEVKDLSACFAETDIKEIPEELFKSCTKIEDLSYCFRECENLVSIPKGLLDECKEVKDLSYCFAETDIEEIPEGLFKFCAQVKDLGGCFDGCELKKIPKEFISIPCHQLEDDTTLIKSIDNEQRKQIKGTDIIFSGFSALDEVIGGWKKSEVIIIGGRGTTCNTFFINITRNILSSYKIPLAIFSLNNCEEFIPGCCRKTPNELLLLESQKPAEFELLLLESQKPAEFELFHHSGYFIDITEFFLKCRKLKQQYHIQVVFIDTGFIFSVGKETIKQLKMLAKELDITIFIKLHVHLSILSKSPNAFGAADVILHQSPILDKGMSHIAIAKNRERSIGEIISLRLS